MKCPSCQGYMWFHHGPCATCNATGKVPDPPEKDMDTEILMQLAMRDPLMASLWNEIVMKPKGKDAPKVKPPFDPLKAGWIPCDSCNGHPTGALGDACEWCDGLGIVVGPPRDGLEIVRMAAHKFAPYPIEDGSLLASRIREANAVSMT